MRPSSLPVIGSFLIAASLASVAGAATLTADNVPTFDPAAPTVLGEGSGSRPDETQLEEVFTSQYDDIDACVTSEKKRSKLNRRLQGDVELAILLNPAGQVPLGVNAALPSAHAKRVHLAKCLRRAAAEAAFPKYDGPPIVVNFTFELDPGTVYVEE